jgi:hypothetical protein
LARATTNTIRALLEPQYAKKTCCSRTSPMGVAKGAVLTAEYLVTAGYV